MELVSPRDSLFPTEDSLMDLARVVTQPDSPKPDKRRFRSLHRSHRPTDDGRQRFGEISNTEARLMEGVSGMDLLSELPGETPHEIEGMMSEPAMQMRNRSTANSMRSSDRSFIGRVSAPSQPACERISYRRMKYLAKAAQGGTAASFTQAASSIIATTRGSSSNSSGRCTYADQLKEVSENDPLIQALDAKAVVRGASSLLNSLKANGGLPSSEDWEGQQVTVKWRCEPPESMPPIRNGNQEKFRRFSWNKSKGSGTGAASSSAAVECPRDAAEIFSQCNSFGEDLNDTASMDLLSELTPDSYDSEGALSMKGHRGKAMALLTPADACNNASRTSTDDSSKWKVFQERDSFTSNGHNQTPSLTLESCGTSDYEEKASSIQQSHGSTCSRTSSIGPMERTYTVRELPSVHMDEELLNIQKRQASWPANSKTNKKEPNLDSERDTEERSKSSESLPPIEKMKPHKQIQAMKKDTSCKANKPISTFESFEGSTRVDSLTDVPSHNDTFGGRDTWGTWGTDRRTGTDGRCTDQQLLTDLQNDRIGTANSMKAGMDADFDIFELKEWTNQVPETSTFFPRSLSQAEKQLTARSSAPQSKPKPIPGAMSHMY